MASADSNSNSASVPQSSSLPSRPPQSSLPKLSPTEFRVFNQMAERMDYFHEHFRTTWKTMQTACTKSRRPSGMSMRQFLSLGLDFCQMLTYHHTYEERYWFPVLAAKMPAFRQRDVLLAQHEKIHEGLEELEKYLKQCNSGERELRMKDEMKGILDGFGDTLWAHLDDEVKQLGAENMRLFWTREEMGRLPGATLT